MSGTAQRIALGDPGGQGTVPSCFFSRLLRPRQGGPEIRWVHDAIDFVSRVTPSTILLLLLLLSLLFLLPFGLLAVAQIPPTELGASESPPTLRQTADALIPEAAKLVMADPPKAYDMALRANLFSQAANYRSGQLRSLIVAAYAQHSLKNLDAALMLFLAAELIAEDMGEANYWLMTLAGEARCYSGQSKLDDLKKVQARFLILALDLGLSPGNALVYVQGGDLDLVQPDQRKSQLEAELEVASAQDNRGARIEILRRLAFIDTSRGEPKEAIRRLSDQLGLLGPEDSFGRAITLASIGALELGTGRPDAALQHSQEALDLFEKLSTSNAMAKIGEAYSRARVADAYVQLLNPEEARDAYLKAANLYSALGYLRQAAHAYSSAGGVIQTLRNHEEALKYTKKALDLIRKAKDPIREGRILVDLGWAYGYQGDVLRSSESLNAALELARGRSDRQLETSALKGIGAIHEYLKQYQQAKEVLLKALTLAKELQDVSEQGAILDLLSTISLRTKDGAQAKAFAIQELRAGEATHDLWRIGYARYRLAAALMEEGKLSEAIPLLKEVVTTIESVRRHLVSETARLGFLADKDVAYYDLIRALLTLHAQDGSRGYDLEAFQYTERARARTLVEFFSTLRAKGEKASAAQPIRWEISLRNRIESLNAQLVGRDPWPQFPPPNPAALQAELEVANREYAEVVAELKRTHPGALPSSMADPISLKELQSLLTDGAVLIEYVVTETELVIWAVTSDGLHPILVRMGQEELNSRIRSFRYKLERRSTDFQNDAKGLYNVLVTPIGQFIRGAKRIVISPYGELHNLAFGALINPQTHLFLIEEAPLSFIPSGSLLRWSQTQTRSAESKVLAVGIGKFEKFPPLSQAETEAQSVGHAFNNRLVLIGNQATVQRFKSEAGRYNIIHIASHAKVDVDAPLASRLILKDESGHDVSLSTSDIFDLDLHASLVTLSACETSLGKISGGNEVLGFVRGFLFAGASSVIGSQWQVDDASTAELMLALYEFIRNGTPKDEALQAAQRNLLASMRHSHPYYWAAFSLIGDRR